MEHIKDANWSKAISHIHIALWLSRSHSDLCKAALDQYGDHGPDVSGVCRNHFPEPIKVKLRSMAKAINTHNNIAAGFRPPRSHYSTFIKVKRHLESKYGKGFYG